jgi:F-type H+-transporting ATPase subunit a
MAADLHPIFLVEEALKAIGLTTADGHCLIPGNVLHSWVVMAVLIFLAVKATKNITLVPKGLQNFFETLIEGLENFVVANMGEDGRKVFPVLATLFIYILFSNYEGLIPGLDAPTANINTTL